MFIETAKQKTKQICHYSTTTTFSENVCWKCMYVNVCNVNVCKCMSMLTIATGNVGPCFNNYLNNSVLKGWSICPFLKRRDPQQNNMVFSYLSAADFSYDKNKTKKSDLIQQGHDCFSSSLANVLWQRRGQRLWLVVFACREGGSVE